MVLFRGNLHWLYVFCWARENWGSINTSGQDETVKLVIETIVFAHQTHCIPRIGSVANFIPLCFSSSLDIHKQGSHFCAQQDSQIVTEWEIWWEGDDDMICLSWHRVVTFLSLQMRWWGKKWCSQILILRLIVPAAIRSHISTMSRPLYVTPRHVNHYLRKIRH